MFVFAECLLERAILMVSGLELKRTGIGPAVMGWWSMSTLRMWWTTEMPGHVSLLKAGLLLTVDAGDGRAWSSS